LVLPFEAAIFAELEHDRPASEIATSEASIQALRITSMTDPPRRIAATRRAAGLSPLAA